MCLWKSLPKSRNEGGNAREALEAKRHLQLMMFTGIIFHPLPLLCRIRQRHSITYLPLLLRGSQQDGNAMSSARLPAVALLTMYLWVIMMQLALCRTLSLTPIQEGTKPVLKSPGLRGKSSGCLDTFLNRATFQNQGSPDGGAVPMRGGARGTLLEITAVHRLICLHWRHWAFARHIIE